jgi:hypothetical protein
MATIHILYLPYPILSYPNPTQPNPPYILPYTPAVFIEQPCGVGFSYSDQEDPYASPGGDYITGDAQAAKDNYALVQVCYIYLSIYIYIYVSMYSYIYVYQMYFMDMDIYTHMT